MSSIMKKEVDTVNHFPPSSASAVFEEIHTIMHLFRASQCKTLRGTPLEMAHMENKALGYIASHPGATQRDLVQRSGRDKAQVTRLVQGLREQGLIDVRTDPADKRSSRLFLTATGTSVHASLHARGAQLAADALVGLSAQERQQLHALLERVQANLRGADA